MDPLLLGTASAFGLAAAAGLNTTLPLLIVGLLARAGLLTLASPFDALAADVTLAGLGFLALLELAGDKVPGLDSGVQMIQLPIAAAAGAILFASQTSVITRVSPELAIIVGLLTAGGVHALRTAFRPVVTAFTAGFGNAFVSSMEDLAAVSLAATAILAPFLGIMLVVGLVLVALTGGRILRRRRSDDHGVRLPPRGERLSARFEP